MPIVRLRVRGVDRDRASRDGDVEVDDARGTPSVEALGDEISLEQCERLFVCLRFRACRAMCETVYRAYAMNPNAPRPLRARTTPSLEETGETGEEETREEEEEAADALEDVKAAARRARRPERYPEEYLALASDSDESEGDGGEEEARGRSEETRWPVEDAYARDAPWVASCLWTQCKFKSNEGLAKTFDEDVELLCEGVPREMRSIGPQMRMLWCKLKWEEGEAKRAGTPEEREVERATLELFEEAASTDALDPEKNPDEDSRKLWSEALGNLAWLYASQILAKQRGDETRARLWLEEAASMLDPTTVSAIKSWITDARTNRKYRFEMTYDEVTDRTVVRKKRVDGVEDEDEDEDEERGAETETEKTNEKENESEDRPGEEETMRDDASPPSMHLSPVDAAFDIAREITRDPVGDVALRAYAAAAVSAYAAYAIAQRARAWMHRFRRNA